MEAAEEAAVGDTDGEAVPDEEGVDAVVGGEEEPSATRFLLL